MYRTATSLAALLLGWSALAAAQETGIVIAPATQSSLSLPAHSSGNRVGFRVTNRSASRLGVRFACAGAGSVAACSVAPQAVTLEPGGAVDVALGVAVGVGSGVVRLSAAAGTSRSVTTGVQVRGVVAPAVSVTPDGEVARVIPSTTEGVVQFTILNLTAEPGDVAVTCQAEGVVACGALSASSLRMAGGAEATVTASYTISRPGIGAVVLTATAAGGTVVSDRGRVVIHACGGRCR